jgi:hypothetical protein
MTMNQRMAVALTVVGIMSLTAQQVEAQRPGRIEIPRIMVDVPAISIMIPAIVFTTPRVRVDDGVRVDIPPMHVDIPETPLNVPALNFELPAIHIDLSNLGRDIETAVQDAIGALDDLDMRDSQASDIARVQRLRRQWREAARRADWQEADALARQLTKAADRLKTYK